MATIENLLQNDPFYRAGLINLKNVRSFEEDPRLKYKDKVAPLFTGVDPAALAKAKEGMQGYTFPSEDLMYIRDINNPTIKTAGTTTHEGIHQLLNRDDWDMMSMPYYTARYADSDIGPAQFYGPSAKRHEELLTRYLVNQIYGEDKPLYSDVEGIDYATMMRPGEGPLGIEKLKKILAKRADPFLKKTAFRAHRNIEAEAAQKAARPKETYVSPARPHGDGRDFQPQRPTRPGGFTDPGKGSYGPWKATGGIIDKPLPGRSRYL